MEFLPFTQERLPAYQSPNVAVRIKIITPGVRAKTHGLDFIIQIVPRLQDNIYTRCKCGHRYRVPVTRHSEQTCWKLFAGSPQTSKAWFQTNLFSKSSRSDLGDSISPPVGGPIRALQAGTPFLYIYLSSVINSGRQMDKTNVVETARRWTTKRFRTD